jgi:hypothetical protein
VCIECDARVGAYGPVHGEICLTRRTHAHAHARTCARTQAQAHTCARTCTRARAHTHTHTRTGITQAQPHSCTPMGKQPLRQALSQAHARTHSRARLTRRRARARTAYSDCSLSVHVHTERSTPSTQGPRSGGTVSTTPSTPVSTRPKRIRAASGRALRRPSLSTRVLDSESCLLAAAGCAGH